MAGKKQTTKSETGTTDLKVHMKMGILQTIAKSIYSGAQGKIREAVANSIDNKARNFIIYLDRATRTISLFDDGNGISGQKFAEIFNNLGLGLGKHEAESISYFGLGLMSVIRLGNVATIITKSSKTGKMLKMKIQVSKIFDDKNEAEDISFIEKCIIPPSKCDGPTRNAISSLSDSIIKSTLGGMPASFTELVIEDVPQTEFDTIATSDFREEISKILPLGMQEKEVFIENISDAPKRKWIRDLFKDVKYCPTIAVHMGIKEEGDVVPLSKYFPTFKRDLSFEEPNISCGTSADKKFKYFFLFTTEDLEESSKENAETGFWVRSRNFLVKPADFFQQPGSRKKYIHEPLKNWIYGEIYHENMKSFLNVSRTDYVWDSDDFTKFRKSVVNLVQDLNKKLRKVWKYSKEIETSIITPFLDISASSGPFYRATKTITDMGIDCEGEHAEKILKDLGKKRDKELESCVPIDSLIKQTGSEQIVLANDENLKVVIDKRLDNGRTFHKSIDFTNDEARALISISPELFTKKDIVFLSKSFSVIFVTGSQHNRGISIDPSDAKIYVNPFNHDLMKYSVSFIDVYIAVELAHIMAQTKDEMKDYLLSLLGRNYITAERFMSPLSDDLQRKKRSRKK